VPPGQSAVSGWTCSGQEPVVAGARAYPSQSGTLPPRVPSPGPSAGAAGCADFGMAARTLPALWNQHRCSLLSGKTSRRHPRTPAPRPRRRTSGHPSHAGGVAEPVSPGLGGLPVAVRERDELLPPSARTDQHQQAQPGLLQPDVDADPVGPHVVVVHPDMIGGVPWTCGTTSQAAADLHEHRCS